MQNYLLTYIITLCFAGLASFAVLLKVNFNMGSEREVKLFRRLIISLISYIIVDIIWALMVYGNLGKVKILLHILTIIDTALPGIMVYYWFLYVEEFLQFKYFRKGVPKLICSSIMYLYFFLIITSFKTSFIYSIDENCYIYMGKYSVHIVMFIIVLFLGGATFHGFIGLLYNAFYRKNKELMRRSVMVTLFNTPVNIGLFLYYKYMLAICLIPSVFISILFFFLSMQDTMIYTDNLTGLYNRKKLENIKEDNYNLYKNEFMVYCIDLDKFKAINDNYGHYEGDRVLKLVGIAFKNLEFTYKAVPIRIGGDEFIIIVFKNGVKNLDFKTVIRNEIAKVVKNENLPYEICMSIGKGYCNKYTSIDKALKMADNEMYKEKQKNYSIR